MMTEVSIAAGLFEHIAPLARYIVNAIPHFFGHTTPLFGWFHPAVARGPHAYVNNCVAVLCPALGHEYMYSYRAYRVLAERLAGAGIATLRFDYAGTGDSAGTPHDGGLVESWRTSIHRAIDHARSMSGRDNVLLVGLRMGGTLAASVAAERDDISGLALWNPCNTGKAFVRQVKILATTAEDLAGSPTIDEQSGDLEGLGFAFTPETVSALSSIDLTQLSPSSDRLATNLLVLSRDDMQTDAAIAERLSGFAETASAQTFPDYASFMLPPIRSRVPVEAIDNIVGWAKERYPEIENETHTAAKTVEPVATMSYDDVPVREHAERFAENRLFGVLTEPTAGTIKAPAVVFLNTGGDHHVGPHRMYVPLARKLATRGVRSFRFDFAGLGDSPAPAESSDADTYPPSAIADIQAAIEHLRHIHGVERVILVGLCSGGYYAVHAAYDGLPVSGVIAINPQLYWREGDPLDINPFWNEREANRIGAALFSPKYWGRALRGDVDYKHVADTLKKRALVLVRELSTQVRNGFQTAKPGELTPVHSVNGTNGSAVTRPTGEGAASQPMARKPRERNVMKLIRPTVDTHIIFSDKDTGLAYLHENVGTRLAELQRRPSFTLSVVDGAGHTFMLQRMQTRLADTMLDWLGRHFSR